MESLKNKIYEYRKKSKIYMMAISIDKKPKSDYNTKKKIGEFDSFGPVWVDLA